MYGAIRALRGEVNFETFPRREFLSSEKGSTIADLVRCAEFHGYRAYPMEGLTLIDLKRIQYPVIVNTKVTIEATDFEHYEVVLGSRGGKLLVLDAPLPIRAEDPGMFAYRWNGVGVIVAPSGTDIGPVALRGRLRIASLLLVGVGVCFGARGLFGSAGWNERHPWLRRRIAVSVAQGTLMLGAALGIGATLNVFGENGLAPQGRRNDELSAARAATFERVSRSEVRRLIEERATVIDARWPADFKLGHIPGAVNLSPDASDDDIANALAGLMQSKSRAKIVVYCQSAGCSYAEQIARSMRALGFEQIFHYRAGWVDWDDQEAE